MKLYLYGITALEWWSRASGITASPHGTTEVLTDCTPCDKSVEYARSQAPFLSNPLHVLVPSSKEKRNMLNVKTHMASTLAYPPQSFCRAFKGVYASTPALSFLQVASDLPLSILVYVGSELCGTFRKDPFSPYGLAERQALLSRDELHCYLDTSSSLKGVVAARKASELLVEKAASPKEIELAIKLTLPYKLGGFSLPQPSLNYRIDLSLNAQTIARCNWYVADLCWPEAKLVVEYDSDAVHLTSEQKASDEIRRNALEFDGYKVISATKLQTESPKELAKIARVIARRLGKRIRPTSTKFEEAQRQLFRELKLCQQYGDQR